VTISVHPPALALVRTRIAGFASLGADEQLRAAAFALKRDLGVDAPQLQLAAKAIGSASAGEVAIAFVSTPRGDVGVPAQYIDAMSGDSIYWFDAPTGYAIGPSGAVSIERASGAAHELPNEILSMLTKKNAVTQVTLISPRQDFDTSAIHLWQAATGAKFSIDTANRIDESRLLPLRTPAKSLVTQSNTALDRALAASCIASLLCVLLAGVYWVTARNNVPVTTANGDQAPARTALAGDLFVRITTISPELARTTKSATFGGGAWVIALSATENLETYASALRNNGLAVQTITQPEPRLRVSTP
jgi:hypothetical protein